jgi:DNA-binding response OmpR family regulator
LESSFCVWAGKLNDLDDATDDDRSPFSLLRIDLGVAVKKWCPVPRILVVDDEPLISMLMEDWLTELGCEVVGPAGSVRRGLDLIADGKLDGAILDVNLAGEDAYAVADALLSKRVPFAFATGDGALDTSRGFADALMLKKPFDFEAMKSVVGKLLERR